jgi:hypothetical protein
MFGLGCGCVKNLSGWTGRISLLLLMYSPALYWIGSLQYVKHQHEQACARDGGLKVFIQPEKADRVQLSQHGLGSGEGVLERYFPSIQMVEAADGSWQQDGKPNYFAYTVDPATANNPKSKYSAIPSYKFVKTPIAAPSKGLYTLKAEDLPHPDGNINRFVLEKDGKSYAQWTEYQTIWNPDGVLPSSWQCFTIRQTKRVNYDFLIELLIK